MKLNVESREDIVLQHFLHPFLLSLWFHPVLHPVLRSLLFLPALYPSLHPVLHPVRHPALRSLLYLYRAKRAADQIDDTTVDGVGGEGVNVDPALRTHHLASAHSVEDAHLLGRERRLELFGALRATGALQVFHPFEDSVALGAVHAYEGFHAKNDRLRDFFLRELAVNVDSTLNYRNSSATDRVEGGLLSSNEILTGSEAGKRTLKACLVPVTKYRMVHLSDLLWCA